MSRNLDAFNVDTFPNICPICHHAMAALYLSGTALRHNRYPDGVDTLSAAFRCQNAKCLALLVSYYDEPMVGSPVWRFKDAAPKRFLPVQFDPRINNISPQFVEIYDQAAQAGSSGLEAIHGVGLRKAFEDLIKD